MSDLILLARVLGSLVAVVLLALLAARFARRTTQGRDGGDLRVCDRVGLTRDTAAVVLINGGRRLLLGVCPAQITLLADLGPAEESASAGVPTTSHENLTDEPTPPSNPPAAPPTVPPAAPPAAPPAVPPVRPPAVPIPGPRRPDSSDVRITQVPLSRKAIRELQQRRRRVAIPPTQRGTGSVLDPRTWQQGLETLRDLTARRG